MSLPGIQSCSGENDDMHEDASEYGSETYSQLISATKAYPSSYAQTASRQGTITRLTYETKDYVSGSLLERQNAAMVYIPYGYDENTRYNVVYLIHGHYGNETTFLTVDDGLLKNVLDNMIQHGDIDPLIVVTPTYNYGSPTSDYVSADPYCKALPLELQNDLIPLVESRYGTFAQDTTLEDLKASRDHRAIGGFSMGGVTTWYAFDETLQLFRYFLPMSGDCWSLGAFAGMSRPAETSEYLSGRVKAQGFSGKDFYIWAASGTGDSAYSETLNQVRGMNEYGSPFTISSLTFHQKDGARHEYIPMVEYIYNALQFFFPTDE